MSDEHATSNGQAAGRDGAGDPRLDTQLLQAAVEGELTAEQSATFERALADDPELTRLVHDLRKQRELLRGLPVAEPPAGFRVGGAGAARLERAVLLAEPVDEQAAENAAQRRSAGRADRAGGKRKASPLRWLAAAAALGGVVALGLYASGFGDDRPTLVDMADRLAVVEPAVAPTGFGRRGGRGCGTGSRRGGKLGRPRSRSRDRGAGVPRGRPLDATRGGGRPAGLPPPRGRGRRRTRPRRRGAPGPPGGDGFQLGFLDDLARGERTDVPRWARSETYFTFPRTGAPNR